MEGQGTVVGKKAPDFTLWDHLGGSVKLSEAIQVAPALLIFYPADFTPVCTKQLCDYRNNMESFVEMGVQLFGISRNRKEEHVLFAEEHKFPFLLLSDPNQQVAKSYGCSSLLMLGNISRAVFIINTKGMILYRYVEPVSLTHRSAEDLLGVLKDLKAHELL